MGNCCEWFSCGKLIFLVPIAHWLPLSPTYSQHKDFGSAVNPTVDTVKTEAEWELFNKGLEITGFRIWKFFRKPFRQI